MSDNKNNSYLGFLNVSATIILLICFCSLIILFTYLLQNNGSPISNNFDVITNVSLTDSTKQITFEDYSKIINHKVKEITKVELLIENKIEEINSFYKFIGTILAVIIAITGFFGFKSIQELKKRTIENSIETATSTAKEEVNKKIIELKEVSSKTIESSATKAELSIVEKYYKYQSELEAFQKDLDNAQKEIEKIEMLDGKIEVNKLNISDLMTTATKKKIVVLTDKKEENK